MNILVCGGAGYIGSHMIKMLDQAGHHPITFDNLSTGHRDAVKWGAFTHGDLLNPHDLEDVFASHPIDAVMHFAAKASVGESVENPAKYYCNNVIASINLLEAMRHHRIRKLIFSSSCAVFGTPTETPIHEGVPKNPINPYGRTKLILEQALSDYGSAYGLNSVSLRYFNAAGLDPAGELGERHDPETHLIPNVIKKALAIRDGLPESQQPTLKIFGDDYPTPDGTCIRDYIHVQDLCAAHLKGIEYLDANDGCHYFNLGSGRGFSVKEVISAIEYVVGTAIPYEIVARRHGDPPRLVADNSNALAELTWEPTYREIEPIVASAWEWFSKSGHQ